MQSSETIRYISCKRHLKLGISEEEWVLLIMAIGRIKDIQNLSLYCMPGSHDFRPFEAVADAVNNAHTIRKLTMCFFPSVPPELIALADSSGMIALANALQQLTALQDFTWCDLGSWREAVPRDFSADIILRALPACPTSGRLAS
jgi:hypothetical protein